MTFASPELLVGLVLVPLAVLIYLVAQRRRSRYAVRFTNVDLLSNLVPRRPAWRRHVPPVFYVLAVVLTIDVSRSMRATDVDPSRLAAAQEAAGDFVDQLPERFRVGLVVFSTEARLVVAPTTDRELLHGALDRLQADGGTALGDAIALSLEAAGLDVAASTPAASPDPSASPAPSAGAVEAPVVATVLLSDGANSTGSLEPIDAAEQAAALGVPVYTIALGTPDGVVDVPNDFGFLEPLSVPPDPETLATVAELTGGRLFEAPTAADLATIYENLGSRVGVTEEKQEVTQLFAAAGLAPVLAGAGLAAHWFNRFP